MGDVLQGPGKSKKQPAPDALWRLPPDYPKPLEAPPPYDDFEMMEGGEAGTHGNISVWELMVAYRWLWLVAAALLAAGTVLMVVWY
ncbi:MAG: hypothetical protein EBR79_01460 [Proteobacteria bacterium]|nr:hypothetical protein [Pseudomonadota bacterium]NBX86494.1 hypothetical protein [Pseudomonadota bacterium]